MSLGDLAAAVSQRLSRMSDDSVVQRIWSRDPTVWGGSADTPELRDRLGWLDVVDRAAGSMSQYSRLAQDVGDSYDTVVLCGMGGSGLAAEVLYRVVGGREEGPRLILLDSTTPAAVRAADDAGRSLFLISSKSGTTIETTSLLEHFWQLSGGDGANFVAITDPETPLYEIAKQRRFRAIFEGEPSIGGRFSALSPFGLAPASLVGIDVDALVRGAQSAMETCRRHALSENPGARLGAVIGEAAAAGRDKLTFFLTSPLASFGLWVEQLVAESTGKEGKGVLPVVDDGSCDLDSYGTDRLFVSLALQGDRDA